jgi:hypothetical protein
MNGSRTYLSYRAIEFRSFVCTIPYMGGTVVPTVVLAIVITAVSTLEIVAYRKRRRQARLDWLRQVLGGHRQIR